MRASFLSSWQAAHSRKREGWWRRIDSRCPGRCSCSRRKRLFEGGTCWLTVLLAKFVSWIVLTAVVAAAGWAEAIGDVGVDLGGAKLASVVFGETGGLNAGGFG